jgi:hypothetical protein
MGPTATRPSWGWGVAIAGAPVRVMADSRVLAIEKTFMELSTNDLAKLAYLINFVKS